MLQFGSKFSTFAEQNLKFGLRFSKIKEVWVEYSASLVNADIVWLWFFCWVDWFQKAYDICWWLWFCPCNDNTAMKHILFLHSRRNLVYNDYLFEYQQ